MSYGVVGLSDEAATLKLLLKKGAKLPVGKAPRAQKASRANQLQDSPLIAFAYACNLELIKTCLELGANPSEKCLCL